MNIRLNKVIRELNVGIDTIVDYLRENGFEVNATPNEKINDEQYDLLKKKFGADRICVRKPINFSRVIKPERLKTPKKRKLPHKKLR